MLHTVYRPITQEPQHQYDIPRVSPYRLAAHLMSAFTIYALLLWTTLSVALPTSPLASASTTVVQVGTGGVAQARVWFLCGDMVLMVQSSTGCQAVEGVGTACWRADCCDCSVWGICSGPGCWSCLQYISTHGRSPGA